MLHFRPPGGHGLVGLRAPPTVFDQGGLGADLLLDEQLAPLRGLAGAGHHLLRQTQQGGQAGGLPLRSQGAQGLREGQAGRGDPPREGVTAGTGFLQGLRRPQDPLPRRPPGLDARQGQPG